MDAERRLARAQCLPGTHPPGSECSLLPADFLGAPESMERGAAHPGVGTVVQTSHPGGNRSTILADPADLARLRVQFALLLCKSFYPGVWTRSDSAVSPFNSRQVRALRISSWEFADLHRVRCCSQVEVTMTCPPKLCCVSIEVVKLITCAQDGGGVHSRASVPVPPIFTPALCRVAAALTRGYPLVPLRSGGGRLRLVMA